MGGHESQWANHPAAGISGPSKRRCRTCLQVVAEGSLVWLGRFAVKWQQREKTVAAASCGRELATTGRARGSGGREAYGAAITALFYAP
jgi:hypothetical protein